MFLQEGLFHNILSIFDLLEFLCTYWSNYYFHFKAYFLSERIFQKKWLTLISSLWVWKSSSSSKIWSCHPSAVFISLKWQPLDISFRSQCNTNCHMKYIVYYTFIWYWRWTIFYIISNVIFSSKLKMNWIIICIPDLVL